MIEILGRAVKMYELVIGEEDKAFPLKFFGG
jgi:hypothetical protein